MLNDSNEISSKLCSDATTKAYSAIDVAAFDPLITDMTLIEELAFALAIIQLPDPFFRIFATSKTGALVSEMPEHSDYLDRCEPSRVYRNALKQIFETRFYRQRSKDDDKIYTNEPYKLVGYKPTKITKENHQKLLTYSLEDIGRRIYDLAEPVFSKARPENDAEPLTPIVAFELLDKEPQNFIDWSSELPKTIQKVLDSGEFSRRKNSISVVNPIGLMHRYRQHFFYATFQKGRCELIRSLAPYETLEVVTTQEKVTTAEESVIRETELTTSIGREQKDSTELTDRIASTVARSFTTNIAANGSYTAVLWSAGGSASSSSSESSMKTADRISKTLNEITLKQSEQIRKKTTVTTRIAETRSDSVTTRHTFQNQTDKPVTYGLYKLGYEVKSVIQDLGALLVWQTRIEKPGQSLAVSEFLDKKIIPAELDLVPVRVNITLSQHIQVGPVRINSASALLSAFNAAMDSVEELKGFEKYQQAKKEFLNAKGSDFEMKISSIDFSGRVPGRSNGVPVNWNHLINTKTADIQLEDSLLTTAIDIRPGFNYNHNTLTIVASVQFRIPKIIKAGYMPPLEGGQSTDSLSIESIELNLKLSGIRAVLDATLSPRDRASLNFEERKTILAAKISTLMQAVQANGSMGDEILMLYLRINDIFDVSQLFYDVDTFEYQEAANLATLMKTGRPNYPLISGSDGRAPTGASLGWKHQVDGDMKRDMFLNAPFAWACLPVRPGKEEDAVEFLHEQNIMLGNSEEITKLLVEMKVARAAESKYSPEQITVDAIKSTPNEIAREYIDKVVAIVDDSIDEASGLSSISIEDALECIKDDIKGTDVYPIISAESTFVTIDGLAFQEIEMRKTHI